MTGHYRTCPSPASCWCEVRRLSWVLAVTGGILALEIAGGIYSGSLALFADAGHVFVDGAAVVVALTAAILAKFSAHIERVRLVAFKINIFLLYGMAAWIAFEAIRRFFTPHEVLGPAMTIVAVLGGMGNLIQHRILGGAAKEHKHKVHHSLDLHVISDFIQSVFVVIGGVCIWISGINWIDPLLSLGIAVWIAYRTRRLSAGFHGH